MIRVYLYLAYGVALTGLGVFAASQTLPQAQAGPALAISLPLTMCAALLIRYLQKRSNDSK